MLKKFSTIAMVTAILSTSTSIGFAPAQKQKASDEKLIVGILRPDSVIIPFAQYANRKWSNPWHSAQPDDQANEPDTIADLPKPWFDSFVKSSSEWYLWSSSGVATTLTTSKTVQVCSHCQQVWGLLTDYPNAKQPEKNECVRNVGAVLSEKRHARAMEKLTDASPDWKQIMTFVGPEFERAESVG